MPDITMCSGEGCDQKSECYRHTASPGEMQSYFSEVPRTADGCDHFMPDQRTPVIITEVHNGDGNLSVLEARTRDGKHVLNALWDPTEEHTPETRAEFRKWFTGILSRKKYRPIN